MHFLGGVELAKIYSKTVRRTLNELHPRLPLQYTCAMVALVNQLNINGDAHDPMFERSTPTSIVPIHLLGGEKLAKISSKSVCRTQPELHTRLLLKYTSAMEARVNQLKFNGDAPGRMFK